MRTFTLVAALCLLACSDGGGAASDATQDSDASPLALGAACTADAQCSSELCYDECIDPEADDDGDGLINAVERVLGTDPLSADSDSDGTGDVDELGGDLEAPLDSDGDGIIDALESSIDDSDDDGCADQYDATDGPGGCVN